LAALTRSAALLCLGCLGLGLLGCAGSQSSSAPSATSRGFNYTVKPGDNLYQIGKRFGVPVAVLVRANRIGDVTELSVGQRIYIPARSRNARARNGAGRAASSSAASSELRRRVREEARRSAKLTFAWPLSQTKLTSRFGRRKGQPHEGIDLASKQGTAIRAAEAGKVIHAGRLGAYGNVVILKHAGHYSSVYAHVRRLLVRKGQFVERSQKIAEVGMTGRTTGPHLHFEIRRKDLAKDPLLFLP
jgi:murein DD-endopeptidase MepM/ murein hydrolase activator NlpD